MEKNGKTSKNRVIKKKKKKKTAQKHKRKKPAATLYSCNVLFSSFLFVFGYYSNTRIFNF